MSRKVHQAAAIPYRRADSGSLEICLITSRNTGAWTFPKGTIDEGYDSVDTALKESHEEAGLSGIVEGPPVGTYKYSKWGRNLTVEVHVMLVRHEAHEWDEDGSRQRRWFTPEQARKALPHDALRDLLDRALHLIAAR